MLQARSSIPRHPLSAAIALLVAALVGACCGGAKAAAPMTTPEGDTAIHLTDRMVDLTGTVNMTAVKSIRDKMLELDRQSHDPVWLRINSGGGSVEAGLILIDTFKGLKSPVNCLVESKAYSMAAIMLVFCDKKYAYPHATIMLHEASYGTVGEDPSNRSRLEFLTRYLDRMHVQIAKAIKMPLDKYRARIRDAWWLLADEALQAHVIDGVVGEISSSKLTTEQVERKKTVVLQEKRAQLPDGAGGAKIPKRRD